MAQLILCQCLWIKENYAIDIWEVMRMATKSILKDVTIKDRNLARTFADALEYAKNNVKSAPVNISRKCTEIKGDKIKAFFDN